MLNASKLYFSFNNNICCSVSAENDLRSHNKLIDDMLNASGVYLDKGVAYFQTICDTNNVALLTSNSARLLRIRAQVIVSSERGEFTPQERTLYNQVTLV